VPSRPSPHPPSLDRRQAFDAPTLVAFTNKVESDAVYSSHFFGYAIVMLLVICSTTPVAGFHASFAFGWQFGPFVFNLLFMSKLDSKFAFFKLFTTMASLGLTLSLFVLEGLAGPSIIPVGRYFNADCALMQTLWIRSVFRWITGICTGGIVALVTALEQMRVRVRVGGEGGIA
jgi:hypothetical protein